jgi:hypothetical protein
VVISGSLIPDGFGRASASRGLIILALFHIVIKNFR